VVRGISICESARCPAAAQLVNIAFALRAGAVRRLPLKIELFFREEPVES